MTNVDGESSEKIYIKKIVATYFLEKNQRIDMKYFSLAAYSP